MKKTGITMAAIVASGVVLCGCNPTSDEGCEWEQKKANRISNSAFVTGTKPRPSPQRAPKAPGSSTTKRPAQKPVKPAHRPKTGYKWVLDCD